MPIRILSFQSVAAFQTVGANDANFRIAEERINARADVLVNCDNREQAQLFTSLLGAAIQELVDQLNGEARREAPPESRTKRITKRTPKVRA